MSESVEELRQQIATLEQDRDRWRRIADALASTLAVNYDGPKPRAKVDIENLLFAYNLYHENVDAL